MKRATIIEKVIDKLRVKTIVPILSKKRREKLNSTDFTIISNNCWGGVCYEYFNIEKKSPTIGCYFFAADFVKFCKNLKYYLKQKLVLIDSQKSIHREELHNKGEDGVIVGKLDDVEIVFLHYKDKNLILDKWQRRVKRINYDKIILKFSYQNGCNDELINDFLAISEYPKICFCGEKLFQSDDIIVFPWHDGKTTFDETIHFGKFFDVVSLINSKLN